MDDKHTILVVDDERLNRQVLADLLKDDHQVIIAKSGEQALERLGREPPIDLVLLDVMMPEMDGYTVLERIKDNDATKEVPVIFITALNSEDDEEKGLRLGAADYIGKPFRPAIVKARVENHLGFVRQRKLLERLAGRDGLTEIPNRRCFDETLEREWRRTQRNGQPLSLAMADVDSFKPFNDHYGHARGDQVLKSVAKAISWNLRRPADMVARYGGEEFVMLFPDTDREGALALAEHLRQAVAMLAIPHAHTRAGQVTISVGGATLSGEGISPHHLLEAADTMLYRAKAQGKNQVAWGE